MTIRTTEKIVTFKRPFFLRGFDEILPPGTYKAVTDEKLLEGVSFAAYQRVQTILHLHPTPASRGFGRTVTIAPNELDDALGRDVDTHNFHDNPGQVDKTPETGGETDLHAVSRAEDGGMIVLDNKEKVSRSRQKLLWTLNARKFEPAFSNDEQPEKILHFYRPQTAD